MMRWIGCFLLCAVFLLAAVLPAQAGADPLDQWHWRSPLPQGNPLTAFAYGNGVFVGVGGTGSIIRSSDGVAWSAAESGTAVGLKGATYGNGTFVAVGSEGTILTSADGALWTKRQSGTTMDMNGITYALGLFVVVGEFGTVLTSPDGILWTAQARAILADLFAVTYGNGIFVAAGEAGFVVTSIDGVTWKRATETMWLTITCIAAGNGVFVALSSNDAGMLLVSQDGRSWEQVWSPKGPPSKVLFAGGRFVAAGRTDTLLTSENGFDWTIRTSGYDYNDFSAAGYGNGLFVVAGISDPADGAPAILFTSPDTVEWTKRSLSVFGFKGNARDVTYGNGTFIVTSSMVQEGSWKGAILSSPDGESWGPVFIGRAISYTAPTYGAGRFLAFGSTYISTTSVIISADGGWWLETALKLPRIYSVTWGNGLYVAVGEGVFTSADGVNWTERLTGTSLSSVVFANGLFVAVGSGVYTSPDGLNWTKRVLPVGWFQPSGIAFSNGLFVAVGGGGVILSSEDGIGLTLRRDGDYESPSLASVAFGDGTFMAVGTEGTVLTSADGEHWVSRASKTAYSLQKVVFGRGTFLTVGSFPSIILQSHAPSISPIIYSDPRNLDLGEVKRGESSQGDVAVINSGKANLTISSVGDPGPPFAKIGDNCSGVTLEPGAQCRVTYRFAPSAMGIFSASSPVASNDAEANPFYIAVSGTGLAAEISVTPPAIDFGPVLPGTVGGPQTVSVRNDGTDSLLLGVASIGGNDASQFAVSGSGCDNVLLPPAAFCSVDVTFAPASPGLKSAELAIPSSDADEGIVKVPLSGLGVKPVIAVEPPLLIFEVLRAGESATKDLAIRNAGATNLTLSSVTPPEDPFILEETACVAGTVLGPGAACTMIVGFYPATAGSFSSQIEIASDDPENPLAAADLAGGSGPDLTGSWTSLTQACRKTAKGQKCTLTGTFAVRNLGTDKAAGQLRFLLSTDGAYDPGDTVLKQMATGTVKAYGGSVSKRFSLALPTGISASGRYVIAVLDPENAITEADETNNNVIFGPVP
jgi:hypothetical protein